MYLTIKKKDGTSSYVHVSDDFSVSQIETIASSLSVMPNVESVWLNFTKPKDKE